MPKLSKYPVRLGIVEDHPIYIDGIKAVLSDRKEVELVLTASEGQELLDKLKTEKIQIDLILLDLQMDGMSGLETAKYLAKDYPEIKILVLTNSDEMDDVKNMVKVGVHGYMLKNSSVDIIIRGIETVMSGDDYMGPIITRKWFQGERDEKPKLGKRLTPSLTDREKEILKLVKKGMTSEEITHLLTLKINTVKTHRKNALAKNKESLGVNNMVELIAKLTEMNWL